MAESQTTDPTEEFGTDVERVGSGYAPLKDDGNFKSREVREAEAWEELGGEPIVDPNLPEIPTDAEVAASVERSRSAPFTAPIERKTVIVEGVAMLVGAGEAAEGATVPEIAKEVLKQAAQRIRTAQMMGDTGLPTFDLSPDSTSGDTAADAEARIAATQEAMAEAEPAPAPPPPPPSEPA